MPDKNIGDRRGIEGGLRELYQIGMDALLRTTAEVRQARWRQLYLRRRRAIIRTYLERSGAHKLQLGAGDNPIEGWLNTDAWPRAEQVAYLDVTQAFPLPDESMDYVFSEHLIEHLDPDQGAVMLRECRRVLAPGGKIRLSTPDLQRVVGLLEHSGEPVQERYLAWSRTYNSLPESDHLAVFVVNNFVRAWGHRFIYDRGALSEALEKAGFRDISFRVPGESSEPELSGLEAHGSVIGEDNNRFESMVAEATKP